MKVRGFASMCALALAAVVLLPACVPDAGGPGGSTTTTTTTTVPGQTTTIVYSGPAGNCDLEKVLVGARVRPCQGLANATTQVIITSKVLDPICVDFYGYYPITAVAGTATQGASTVPLVQTDTTPGTPVFDTSFDVANGPITVKITNLSVDTAGGLVCGWFG
ncbi:MAG: hypothetical protein U0Q22_00110 [Acidimicrobiales bacterium]